MPKTKFSKRVLQVSGCAPINKKQNNETMRLMHANWGFRCAQKSAALTVYELELRTFRRPFTRAGAVKSAGGTC